MFEDLSGIKLEPSPREPFSADVVLTVKQSAPLDFLPNKWFVGSAGTWCGLLSFSYRFKRVGSSDVCAYNYRQHCVTQQ